MPLSISNIKKAKILTHFFRRRLRNYLDSGELLPFKDGNGAGLDPKPTRLIHNRRGLGRVYFSPLGSAGSGPRLQVRGPNRVGVGAGFRIPLRVPVGPRISGVAGGNLPTYMYSPKPID